jgi:hypothetical protein
MIEIEAGEVHKIGRAGRRAILIVCTVTGRL